MSLIGKGCSPKEVGQGHPKLLWNAKIRHLRQYLPMASKALLQALFRPSERPFFSPLLRRLEEGFSGGKKDARRRAKISVRKKIYFRTCEKKSPFAQRFFSLRTPGFFPSYRGDFSFGGKSISAGRKTSFPPKEKRAPFGRKNASFRRAKNFRAEGRKFPYIRKFISVYKKKYFRICGNLFPCAQKFFALRKGLFYHPKNEGLPPERIDTEAPKEGRSEALRERKTPISRYFTRGLDALPLRP